MTSAANVDRRHVSVESFVRYLASEVPVVLPIRGTPAVSVFVRPAKPELGLRIEVDPDTQAPGTGLTNIVARVADHEGRHYLEVVVVATALFRDAYAVLCSMADRIQVAGMTPTHALRETLGQLASLLREPESISQEREIGLFGELLTLGGLAARVGGSAAVGAWRGPQGEEHDFGLPAVDVEVKTTIGERRAHWIDSLTQLQPTTDRPLWLVSHQLTGAGVGFGKTLPELIDKVGSTLPSTTRDDFEAKLSAAGWSAAYATQMTSRWERRTESAAFEIDEQFPRLVPDALQQAGLPIVRLIQVRYRVDLDGMASPVSIPAGIVAALGS
ncbi:PD-(D/E)XK motif protein [Micromonospora sp. CV4]|uniref:PD-(D/E)XK motif protein n=1 Tax=Micromonospora sp. CV4 TaxID=2478711 RepID=UPI000EF506F6|nr:PD-(D/E)XK motif protein [Micromonospora sp. CV4]RLP94965.1 PD-(D/E)XK motif protein [Micromonospora sp. CV4]